MDEIWGYVPDEVRPFPALSYQLTALGGPVSPTLHHVLNILIHAANGLLVMAIAFERRPAWRSRGDVRRADVRAVAGSRRERRVDHRPRRLDAGVLLSRGVSCLRSLSPSDIATDVHLVGRAFLRGALYKAKHDHDGGDARRLRRHRFGSSDLAARRIHQTVPAIWRDDCGLSLAALHPLWTGRARGRAQRPRARGLPLPSRPSLQARRRWRFQRARDRRMARGCGSRCRVALDARSRAIERENRSPASRGMPRATSRDTEGACFISGPSGGPLACCRLPSPATIHPATSISPPLAGPSSLRSRSKRHGTFVRAAIGIARSRPPRRSFCCSTSCRCTGLYRNGGPWLRSRKKSRAMCATLRCPRRQEAWSSSAHLDGVGSGRYLLPRVPRISGPISTIASSSFHRARSAAARRHGSRRHAARSRPGRQGPAATRRSRCGGTPTAARSFRPTVVDSPQLPVLIRSLLDMPRPDDLDNTLNRILDVLPRRVAGSAC